MPAKKISSAGQAKIPGEGFHDTNFIRDVRSYELPERKDRGAGGKMLMIEMSNNVMSAHISQFPVGTTRKPIAMAPGRM